MAFWKWLSTKWPVFYWKVKCNHQHSQPTHRYNLFVCALLVGFHIRMATFSLLSYRQCTRLLQYELYLKYCRDIYHFDHGIFACLASLIAYLVYIHYLLFLRKEAPQYWSHWNDLVVENTEQFYDQYGQTFLQPHLQASATSKAYDFLNIRKYCKLFKVIVRSSVALWRVPEQNVDKLFFSGKLKHFGHFSTKLRLQLVITWFYSELFNCVSYYVPIQLCVPVYIVLLVRHTFQVYGKQLHLLHIILMQLDMIITCLLAVRIISPLIWITFAPTYYYLYPFSNAFNRLNVQLKRLLVSHSASKHFYFSRQHLAIELHHFQIKFFQLLRIMFSIDAAVKKRIVYAYTLLCIPTNAYILAYFNFNLDLSQPLQFQSFILLGIFISQLWSYYLHFIPCIFLSESIASGNRFYHRLQLILRGAQFVRIKMQNMKFYEMIWSERKIGFCNGPLGPITRYSNYQGVLSYVIVLSYALKLFRKSD